MEMSGLSSDYDSLKDTHHPYFPMKNMADAHFKPGNKPGTNSIPFGTFNGHFEGVLIPNQIALLQKVKHC